MDWLALQATYPHDRDMPARATRLIALTRVLENKLYDSLLHSFGDEFSDGVGEYIPIQQRRPSVRTGLCRVVVEDSASLLFSEGHWPTIQATSPETSASLSVLVKQARLNQVMLDAATRGSVGSVAIWMRVLSGKPFFDVLPTANLTPVWDPQDPDVLLLVSELYKVTGGDLKAVGYPISDDDKSTKFWWRRMWTTEREIHYQPQRLDDRNPPTEDTERSVDHALGFVPIEWVRNLPGGDEIDGGCTFEAAIDTVIEGDYLLSQAGRGLNYSADPKTVLSIEGGSPPLTGGSANALVLPKGSDAKLLEINGSAATAVIEHVRELRAIALEAVHGNRSNADKLSTATSGRSIEMMMQGLLLLSDKLRLSYGEGALLNLLKMACRASQVIEGGLKIAGQSAKLNEDGLELRWPPWMPPTPQDLLTGSQAIVTAYAGSVVSQKTAVTVMGNLLGVDDVEAEITLINAEAAAKQAQAQKDADAATTRTAANGGKTETRTVTA